MQTKRDNVTKETNEFKGDYGKYMATMSKKVTEGKAEHARLTEHVSDIKGVLSCLIYSVFMGMEGAYIKLAFIVLKWEEKTPKVVKAKKCKVKRLNNGQKTQKFHQMAI